MSTVKVTAGATAVLVVSEKIIDDGRERVTNGVDEIAAGTEMEFVVHAGQSIRVIEIPQPAVATETAPATTAEVTA